MRGFVRALSVVCVLSGAACGLPHDPNGTLERVAAQRLLHVGFAEAPPWIADSTSEPHGVEADLVREFAATLNARVTWTEGNLQDLQETLEHYELDLLVGGLDKRASSSTHVGFTRPYLKERLTLGHLSGLPAPSSLEGVEIAVEPHTLLAALVRKEGANPVPFESSGGDVPQWLAASEWQLKARGYVPTEHVFRTREHVWAVPPGENAWLARIEGFLNSRNPAPPAP